MREQFIIKFNDKKFRYQAEVKAFDLEGHMVFDVYYSIIPFVHPARRVQVYKGMGNGINYWRQRFTDKDEELLPTDFIEDIGFAIEQAQL